MNKVISIVIFFTAILIWGPGPDCSNPVSASEGSGKNLFSSAVIQQKGKVSFLEKSADGKMKACTIQLQKGETVKVLLDVDDGKEPYYLYVPGGGKPVHEFHLNREK